ncbi:uncharacterized protein P174DRAFT_445153 [Aspergillus novofumigatus IBT 16806]|uniref:Uncharacterized protein n=1 Tax=Aspergillus novofumigatus (strain IBT 16806) TaxID=1392255 RepID=A0A2I1BXW9_ASPN1|nr:uncharacterized protein P174DRAFT_445153 [Aspergillus novofumigatus IBT 16806]PKX90216.1 hypothetical protein P174DRAFT_445153 [Aspergillus novofumigatus IBT 16806]
MTLAKHHGEYRTNPKAITSVVFAWPGWVATVARCVIFFEIRVQEEIADAAQYCHSVHVP